MKRYLLCLAVLALLIAGCGATGNTVKDGLITQAQAESIAKGFLEQNIKPIVVENNGQAAPVEKVQAGIATTEHKSGFWDVTIVLASQDKQKSRIVVVRVDDKSGEVINFGTVNS